jgi:hypothetical protein
MGRRRRDRDEYDDYEELDDRDVDDVSASVSDRIQSVIDAAERAAAEILNDAKREAKRQIEDSNRRAEQMAKDRIRSIYELTDGLVDRARNVKDQSDTLLGALDSAIRDIRETDPEALRDVERTRVGRGDRERRRAERGPSRGRRWREPEYEDEREPEPEPEPEPEEEYEPPAPRRRRRSRRRARPVAEPRDEVDDSSLEEARLEATRMAVSGASRRQIRKRLRHDYDLEDPDELVDEILGED